MRSCICARGLAASHATDVTAKISSKSLPLEARSSKWQCDLIFIATSSGNTASVITPINDHIQALDLRAELYEAMGQLRLAVDDAEWTLEFAPRLPDKDEYAWKLYAAGIEACKGAQPDLSGSLGRL
ncbi:uncharacterized protein CPUR_04402 [Claviceps purpurea 20.1]|uniref:Uncharacterized protein n=1 Tax=Claviceps purpurea (strain 20.1) TaxID=1111077 RepID=M1WF32_CLAP2|nr:uncharacterized protein CPUR_04402 [Claviceps purpurea 20.1]